ncbi:MULTISPECIES: (2Fe-2S)-binding protein [unclassified Herbaspirillum]|jgi:nicotinate dehydrogenase subunit A|uniref:(2Fe-2S)-binding protein n=1 Tax=unclassified Herbaspirillum TaxID=2624150 RepID=UPI000E2F3C64|nr:MULTISPECIES: (2Fe-2S)-binding protein [unclassified Herbaspirillum]RFB68646.1 (2Fe-2S)-binding protein [Herbaspirillum sp. 3R-3a1]TFI05552.1 (2Fe-2S)-binding protein [Herbaspirillum sp. 3R11]TFI13538.1 (2Fe-2S)-binding protein [Herbaspirillum sp. 3R-11]TFI19599.1 (2Fe-2S)-binding protein [Herbaspirillum sp. 3C11]
MPTINFIVNGTARSVDVRDPDQPLLYALRNSIGLTGPKFGCGLGQCGACTVLLDQTPLRSCVTPLSAVAGKSITTIEGLGTPDKPHPVQAAFIAEQAAQCGYCANGMVMTSAALLASNPKPSEAEIKDALSANLCRCGTHVRILRAVMRASGRTPA